MFEKEKDLIEVHRKGGMSRREMMKRLSAMGMSATSAAVLFNASATRAMAADFDWKKHSGKSVKLLLNQHSN